MNAKFNNAVTQACTSANGFAQSIATLRTFAADMARTDFKAAALPVVASYYKVKTEQTNRGTLALPRDSASAKFLTRLVSSAYATAGGSNAKADPVAQCIASFASGARKFNRLTPAKQRKVLEAAPHVTQLLKDFAGDEE